MEQPGQIKDIKFNYDLGKDLYVFMKNEPNFYRKELFPVLANMSEKCKNNQEINFAEEVKPCIEKAKVEYVKKYDLPKEPSHLFTDQDIDAIIEQLADDELEIIKKGGY